MKICVVTVPDSANFGSFLQAYAMKAYLLSLGHDVRFAVTRDEKYIKNLFCNRLVGIKQRIRYPLKGLFYNRFNKKAYELYCKERQKHFAYISAEEIQDCDVTLLGSDEIWNIRTPVFRKPVFFGEGSRNSMAYAVSAGRSVITDFHADPAIEERIRNIPWIFARDENTCHIAKEITGREIPHVCDPTLLVDKEIFASELPEALRGQRYVLVYSYGFTKVIKRHIQAYAREKHLKIASAGFYCPWADINVNCKPLDFLTIVRQAECVVTTTFHGSIFAILAEKRFVTIPGGSISKVSDLLQQCKLSDQLGGEDIQYCAFRRKLENAIQYQTVRADIEDFRDASRLALRSVLARFENSGEMNEDSM